MNPTALELATDNLMLKMAFYDGEEMNDIWKYDLAGIMVAVGGMFVWDIAGSFFNGLGGYGFGCILGICMYLCIVVVTCTGIIVTKLNKSTHLDGESDKQSNEQGE